jgi:hypothetical protein
LRRYRCWISISRAIFSKVSIASDVLGLRDVPRIVREPLSDRGTVLSHTWSLFLAYDMGGVGQLGRFLLPNPGREASRSTRTPRITITVMDRQRLGNSSCFGATRAFQRSGKRRVFASQSSANAHCSNDATSQRTSIATKQARYLHRADGLRTGLDLAGGFTMGPKLIMRTSAIWGLSRANR